MDVFSSEINLSIKPLPIVEAGNPFTVCSNSILDLSNEGSPKGGVWSRLSILNNKYDPSKSSGGFALYTYTNPVTKCSNSDQVLVSVNQAPNIVLDPQITHCANDNDYSLPLSPISTITYSWSGNGVVGSVFSSQSVVPGTYELTLKATDNKGCIGTTLQNHIVNALPTVSAGNDIDFCLNEKSKNLNLNVNPVGGLWSGTISITGGQPSDINNYFPSTTGFFEVGANKNLAPGDYQLTYTFKSRVTGCSNSDVVVFSIHNPPMVDAGTDRSFCQTDNSFRLIGSPNLGSWFGTAISQNDFFPSNAAVGKNNAIYTFKDNNSCSNSDTVVFTVKASPIVSAGKDTTVCEKGNDVVLKGSPIGGTFTGAFIDGATFKTSSATSGFNTVRYTVIKNGCSGFDEVGVIVNPLPAINAGADRVFCRSDDDVVLKGSPSKGLWIYNSDTVAVFKPKTASIGINYLVYRFTDTFGCTNQDITEYKVNQLPVVDAGGDLFTCVNNTKYDLTSATPIGGVWSGNIVSNNSINPSFYGIGNYDISYKFTDPTTTCSNSETVNFQIAKDLFLSFDLPTIICSTDEPYYLDSLVNVPGGAYTSPNFGIVGRLFRPSFSQQGQSSITYSYKDNNSGCSNSITKQFAIVPGITISDIPDYEVCRYSQIKLRILLLKGACFLVLKVSIVIFFLLII